MNTIFAKAVRQYAKAAGFLNEGADTLNALFISPVPAAAAVALLTLAMLATAWLTGTALYTPDSWSYLELAKTAFTDHFYKFNTLRSYIPGEYSASFPFGYPLLIAAAQWLTGWNPFVSVLVNIAVMAATAGVIYAICRRLNLGGLMWLAIWASLAFCPWYMAELLAGRSIPAALLFFLTAFYTFLRGRPFVTGLLLGVCALLRFDFLVYGVCFMAGAAALGRLKMKKLVFLPCGFALGILPWCVFSYMHFGRFWASDNSWVAISSLPAYVLDYPALPKSTLFQNPVQWAQKVLASVPGVIRSIPAAALGFTALPFFAAVLVLRWQAFGDYEKKRLFLLFLLLLTALAPYLATGYIDTRYFTLFVLGCCMALAIVLARTPVTVFKISTAGITLAAVTLALCVGVGRLYTLARRHAVNQNETAAQKLAIARYYECHGKHPESVLIFDQERNLAAQYGALTGMKTAMPPSNFHEMTGKQRQEYFAFMRPYLLASEPCGENNGPKP